MKLILFVIATFVASATMAAFNVKPGLWKYELEMEIAGQKFNPMPALEKMMGSLPPEKQKEIRDKLGQNKANMSEVCLTKEMIEKGSLDSKQREDCAFKTKSNTATQISGSFSCKDGTKGSVEWKATSPTAFSGTIDVTTADGKNTEIGYNAHFLKEKCKN